MDVQAANVTCKLQLNIDCMPHLIHVVGKSGGVLLCVSVITGIFLFCKLCLLMSWIIDQRTSLYSLVDAVQSVC